MWFYLILTLLSFWEAGANNTCGECFEQCEHLVNELGADANCEVVCLPLCSVSESSEPESASESSEPEQNNIPEEQIIDEAINEELQEHNYPHTYYAHMYADGCGADEGEYCHCGWLEDEHGEWIGEWQKCGDQCSWTDNWGHHGHFTADDEALQSGDMIGHGTEGEHHHARWRFGEAEHDVEQEEHEVEQDVQKHTPDIYHATLTGDNEESCDGCMMCGELTRADGEVIGEWDACVTEDGVIEMWWADDFGHSGNWNHDEHNPHAGNMTHEDGGHHARWQFGV